MLHLTTKSCMQITSRALHPLQMRRRGKFCVVTLGFPKSPARKPNVPWTQGESEVIVFIIRAAVCCLVQSSEPNRSYVWGRRIDWTRNSLDIMECSRSENSAISQSTLGCGMTLKAQCVRFSSIEWSEHEMLTAVFWRPTWSHSFDIRAKLQNQEEIHSQD